MMTTPQPMTAMRMAHPPMQMKLDNEESLNNPTHVYVGTIIRHGDDDGDPGEIREGMYNISGGSVVLTDLDGRQITSRKLSDGQNPAKLARELLRETAPVDDFNRPIAYPRLGVA
jgi:hypothetical protein